jgi:hypothetical protein
MYLVPKSRLANFLLLCSQSKWLSLATVGGLRAVRSSLPANALGMVILVIYIANRQTTEAVSNAKCALIMPSSRPQLMPRDCFSILPSLHPSLFGTPSGPGCEPLVLASRHQNLSAAPAVGALMLAACSMTFSRDRPRRLLELSGTEAPTLDEETILGQRNGLRLDARLLLRSRR